MNISKSSIAYLCFAWTVFLLLGVTAGLNIPFALAVVGTILYLI